MRVIPQTPSHYIKVPKEVILESTLPEHRISLLIYFNYNKTWDDMVHYSPTYMIQWCSYRPNWRTLTNGKKNIYEKFLICMSWYFDKGYVLDFDSKKYTQNTFQSSLLNLDKTLPSNNFGIIYDFEIEKIMKHQISYKPLNKSVILLLLSYIRAFTWLRSNEMSGHSEKSKKSKPEIFHSNFKLMENYIGVRAKMISKATGVLEDLGIIKTYRMPSYKDDNGQWHTDDIIYICPYKIVSDKKTIRLCSKEEYNWEKELKYGIKYLKESNYSSKKFYQE